MGADVIQQHNMTRSGRLKNTTGENRHGKTTRALRRAMTVQRTRYQAGARANELELTTVINALAAGSRRPSVVRDATLAVWCILTDPGSMDDPKLSAFVSGQTWNPCVDIFGAIKQVQTVAGNWTVGKDKGRSVAVHA